VTRILLLTQDFPPGFDGGIASWSLDLALALHKAGRSVEVLARRTGDTADADANLSFPVHRMRGRSWMRWQGVWAGINAAPKLDRDTVVVATSWRLLPHVLPVARLRGARTVCTFHGSDLTRLGEREPALKQVLKQCDALLPVSQFLAQILYDRGAAQERVAVLPMPLALPDEPDWSQPRQGLLLVARLTSLKGVDRAVRLAEAAGLPLTVIGEGPASAQALGPGVRALGRLPRDQVLAEMDRSAAIVLLPRTDEDGSGAEGLGLCFLEGATRGVPAIGCSTGGVAEAVGPGLLLGDPDAPSPAEIAAVRALVVDGEARRRARAWVEAEHGPSRCLAVFDTMIS
jgi:glycosyltransferase involved in cell wall biosynthesis